LFSLEITPFGTTQVSYLFSSFPTNGFGGGSGPVLTGAVGNATSVVINPDGNLNDTAVGHIAFQNVYDSVVPSITAWVNESPTVRFTRLCGEQNIPAVTTFSTVAPGDSTVMGYQTIDTLPALIQQASDSALALLYEARDQLALAWRTKGTLYNQLPKLTLDHSQHQLSGPLNPVDDDALVRNDVTVTRINGSSSRQVLASGTLSVQPPPNGVGDYATNYSLSLGSDSLLPDQAGWRLRMGTVDQPRYPQISINLRHSTFTSNLDMMNAALTIDIGDRLVVTNPPPWMPPDQISQIVQGYSETLGVFEHDITFNCSPEDPYRIGILDDPVLGRADTDGSTLAAAIGPADAMLSVLTTGAGPKGPLGPVALGVDGTFESGVAGWALGTGTALVSSSAAFHTGSKSGLVSSSTTTIQISTPDIAVTPGAGYALTLWLTLQAGTVDLASARISWFDSGHNLIGSVDSPLTTAGGSWAALTVSQTAPANAAVAQAAFHAHSGGADTAWVDDFTLTALGVTPDAAHPPWTMDPPDFPLDVNIGGERITLTGYVPSLIGAADGTFESGVSGWSVSGPTVAATNADHYQGTASALLTLPSGYLFPTAPVPVTPNTPYFVSAAFKLISGSVSVQVGIQWLDSGGFNAGTPSAPTAQVGSNWATELGLFTSPANAATAYPQIFLAGSNGNQVYIDYVLFLSALSPQVFAAIRAINGTQLALGADGTFETGVANWTPNSATFTSSSAAAHSGTRSGLLTVVGSPSQAYVRTPSIPITAGAGYSLSLWVLAASGTPNAHAAIDWRDSGSSYISTSSGSIQATSGTWVNVAVTGTAPANAAFAQAGPTMPGSPSTGSAIYVDDVVMTNAMKAQSAGTDVRLWQPTYLSL
jgi:hypothetical protein